MLSPSDYNNAVPKFTNGNYASNPDDPTFVEEPSALEYNKGAEPLQTLPAQWWNWFGNQFTLRFNKLNTYVKNIFDELAQFLTLVNMTPSGTEGSPTTGQLKEAFQTEYPKYLALLMYPVGSIYWTSKAPNNGGDPNVLFGGTWTQIRDRFLLARGDSEPVNTTGGERTHTLTEAEMPTHYHNIPFHHHSISHTHNITPVGTVSAHNHEMSHTHEIGAHSHGLNGHVHSLNSHTHSVGAHSHGLNSHTHTLSGTFTTGTPIATNSTSALDLSGSISNLNLSNQTTSITNSGILSTTSAAASWTATLQQTGTQISKISVSANHRHQVTLSGSTGQASGSTANSTAFNSGGPSTTNTGAASGNTENSTAYTSGAASRQWTDNATPTFTGSTTLTSQPSDTVSGDTNGVTTSAGDGEAHNNMPPYIVKYCWERIA